MFTGNKMQLTLFSLYNVVMGWISYHEDFVTTEMSFINNLFYRLLNMIKYYNFVFQHHIKTHIKTS